MSVGSGEVNGDALRLLADAVLDDERVKLALEVREGGPHAVRRAIELAALILADAQARPALVASDSSHESFVASSVAR